MSTIICIYKEVGVYWPEMAKNATDMHMACIQCQEALVIWKSLFIQEAGDWLRAYPDFLLTNYFHQITRVMRTRRNLRGSFLKVVFIQKMLWPSISEKNLNCRTSKYSSTQAMHFSLVYGTKTMIPIEVMAPSTQLALASKLADSQDGLCDKPSKRGDTAKNNWLSYHKQISKATTWE